MFSLDGFQFAMRRERSTVCFDFINAKVRGKRSKLFESHRLRSLAECRTLPDLFRRVYPSRGFTNHLDFERLLLSDHIRHLDKVSRYLSGRVSDLFQWLMVRYQLENLKVVVRVFMSKENRDGQAVGLAQPGGFRFELGCAGIPRGAAGGGRRDETA